MPGPLFRYYIVGYKACQQSWQRVLVTSGLGRKPMPAKRYKWESRIVFSAASAKREAFVSFSITGVMITG